MAAKQGPGGLLAAMRARDDRPGPQCSIVAMLAKMTPADADDVRTAIADDSIRASSITAVLRDAGHQLGIDAVARHRRGACACGRAR